MNTKIYVGNLSPLTTAEDLRMLFNTTGRVLAVNVVKDKTTGQSKGYAFVEMVSQGDVGKAVSEFNGYHLDERRLKVTVAKPETNSRPKRNTDFNGYRSYHSYKENR
jgi:RNA recognition motif-containing protein